MFAIIELVGGLMLGVWAGWTIVAILWNICAKTSNFIDSLFN